MGLYDDSLAEGFDQAPADPFDPPRVQKQPWFDLADVAMAVPRGIVGAVKGAYNLVDTLAVDSLPDWSENPLGESKSIIGGWVEGAAHFTAGFVPFGGGFGFAGLLAKGATTLSKVGRVAAASGLAGFTVFEGHEARLSDLVERNKSLSNPLTAFLASNAEDPELLGRLKNAVEQAGMGAAFEGIVLGVKAIAKGRVAKASVLENGGTPEEAAQAADAAAAEVASPEKMIQLMRDAEGLPVEDPLGLTGVHELPTSMQMRRNKGPAFTPEEHAAFSAEASAKYPNLPQRKAEAQLALDSARENAARADRGDRRVVEEGQPPEGQPERRAPKAAPAEQPAVETAKARGERMRAEGASDGDIANAHLKAMGEPEAPKGPTVEGVNATPEQAKRAPILRRLGLDDEKIKKFTTAYEQKGQAIEDVLGPGAGLPGETAFNPRVLPAADRLRLGLKAADLPMQNFRSPDAANVFSRTIEDFFRAEMEADFKALSHTTLEKMAAESAGKTAEMLGIRDPGAYMATAQVRAGRTLNSLEEAIPLVHSDRTILELANQQVVKTFQQMRLIRQGEVAGNLDEIAVEFGEALQHAAGMKAVVKGQARKAGQLLAAYRNPVGGVEIPPELMRLAQDPIRLKQTLADMGGLEKVLGVMEKYEKAFAIAGEEGADAALMKLSEATYGRKFLDMTTEFFMGSVLSSPQTWVINSLSNGLMQVYAPLERALGSVMIRGSNGRLAPATDLALQSPLLQESLAHISALKRSFSDSFKMLKDHGWDPDGSPQLGTRSELAGNKVPAITAENMGLKADTVPGVMAEWLGKATRTPLKILGGTDVVAKNTYIRAAASARFQTEALQAGIKDPVKIAYHIERRLHDLTTDGQAYTQKSVVQRGLQLAKEAGLKDPETINKYVTDYYAKNFDESLSVLSRELGGEADVATWTNRPLSKTDDSPNTIQNSINQFISAHPALKLVAPFVNTPMNLLKGAGQRADAIGVTRYIIGRVWPRSMPEMKDTANRFLRDMLSGDPRKAADAVGRITVGVGAATFFTAEALAGNITGHGPSDPQQRQALMDTGWQPYSFKVGDSYVSYQRLDPLATFVGTAADMAEYMNHAEDVDDEDHATAITGLAVGMANNFTNKSYLTGFANLVGAMQAPEKKLPEFVRRQVAAFVPNILGTAGYGVGQDPNLREVRSWTDAIMAKIPGLSQKLPPRRNILGEPLERPAAVEGKDPVLGTLVNVWDPIKYSRVKDDVVRTELAALGHSWEPPKRRTNGLDLMEVPAGKTTAYDRWQELQGTVLIGGDALKAALRREIKSPEYRKLTAEPVDGLESPRVGRLNRIIGDYRAAAWKKLMRELPDLKQHNTAFTANKHRVRAGLPAAIIPQLGQ